MPLKDLENSKFYFLDNGEYKPLGHINEFDLTLSDADVGQEDHSKYFSCDPIELKVQIVNADGLMIYLKTGNDLYLRFPKKLRRKKRK